MSLSLHNPARGEDESFKDYRKRRIVSRAVAHAIMHPENFGGDFHLHQNAGANKLRGLKRQLGHRQVKRTLTAMRRAERDAARSA